LLRDSGHEQLISNDERFKPTFAERDKKQTMRDQISQESQQTGLKTSSVPPIRLSRLYGLCINNYIIMSLRTPATPKDWKYKCGAPESTKKFKLFLESFKKIRFLVGKADIAVTNSGIATEGGFNY
jgi:hypothetical protein